MKAAKALGIRKLSRYFVRRIFYACFQVALFSPMRTLILRLMGAKIGRDCVIEACRLQNLHRTGPRGLKLGDRVYVGDEVSFDLADNIVLRDDVTLAARTMILTHMNVGYPEHPLQAKYPSLQKPVAIEDGCFIGADVLITAGVTIGRGSFIYARSLVTGDVPPFSVAAGTPAKIIGRIESAEPANAPSRSDNSDGG